MNLTRNLWPHLKLKKCGTKASCCRIDGLLQNLPSSCISAETLRPHHSVEVRNIGPHHTQLTARCTVRNLHKKVLKHLLENKSKKRPRGEGSMTMEDVTYSMTSSAGPTALSGQHLASSHWLSREYGYGNSVSILYFTLDVSFLGMRRDSIGLESDW